MSGDVYSFEKLVELAERHRLHATLGEIQEKAVVWHPEVLSKTIEQLAHLEIHKCCVVAAPPGDDYLDDRPSLFGVRRVTRVTATIHEASQAKLELRLKHDRTIDAERIGGTPIAWSLDVDVQLLRCTCGHYSPNGSGRLVVDGWVRSYVGWV